MGTMFRTSIYAVCGLFLIGLSSCSNDDDNPVPPPISKGEEAVKEVIENLESVPEVSQFLEVLKMVDVSNLEEDELTVFAVKNPVSQRMLRQSVVTRSAVLDSTSVMRSIAKGSYALNELTHGMILKSINDENLHVTMDENGFTYINGTRIEGNGTLAGNSYIYIIPEVLQSYSETEEPSDSLNINDVRYLWSQSMAKYNDAQENLESQLITGFGGFDYNDIGTVSDKFWDLAYEVVEEGEKHQESIAEVEAAKNLSDSISLDMSILKMQLYGYYGSIIHKGNGLNAEQTKNQLISDLQYHVENLPSKLSESAKSALAKVYLWSQMYNEAKSMCDKITDKTDEVTLIEAIALNNTGNKMEAVEKVNIVRVALSLSQVTSLDNDVLIETCHQCLVGDHQLYPYYRLLEKDINYMATVTNFNPEKHFYLPIPQAAIDKYGLVQNAGYK